MKWEKTFDYFGLTKTQYYEYLPRLFFIILDLMILQATGSLHCTLLPLNVALHHVPCNKSPECLQTVHYSSASPEHIT